MTRRLAALWHSGTEAFHLQLGKRRCWRSVTGCSAERIDVIGSLRALRWGMRYVPALLGTGHVSRAARSWRAMLAWPTAGDSDVAWRPRSPAKPGCPGLRQGAAAGTADRRRAPCFAAA